MFVVLLLIRVPCFLPLDFGFICLVVLLLVFVEGLRVVCIIRCLLFCCVWCVVRRGLCGVACLLFVVWCVSLYVCFFLFVVLVYGVCCMVYGV